MSDQPKRIQRKRTKGWRMPEGAVYVGRPTKWGNRFRVGGHYLRGANREFGALGVAVIFTEAADGHQTQRYTTIATTTEAVAWFRWYLERCHIDVSSLRGKDLACWCRLDQPCHADVLLEVANS
jgi:hypothetical protein